VLDDYALGAVSSLNRDGLTPFDFAAVQADEELDALAQSLEHLAQKGGSEPEGLPEAAASRGDPRPTVRLGHRAGAGHTYATLGARSRADPLRQLGAARGGGKSTRPWGSGWMCGDRRSLAN
jgi:hypothetical protein